MIKVLVIKEQDKLKSISIKGHAMYDEVGKDIVCASVSSLVISTINNILSIDNTIIDVEQNDNNILGLLSCQNNELFLQYFKRNLKNLVITQLPLFESKKSKKLPESFWINHISSTFVETLKWWLDNGRKESPETITEYFYLAV